MSDGVVHVFRAGESDDGWLGFSLTTSPEYTGWYVTEGSHCRGNQRARVGSGKPGV